jgi:tRNA (Thr-GGU) A37 N-methylase
MSDSRTQLADSTLVPVGWVPSPLIRRADAPKQGYEGAPDAWLVIAPSYARALEGLEPGQDLLVLTWLHQATRDVLVTRPRDDPAQPITGVFATRSPDRPNPIGLHRCGCWPSRTTARFG